MQKKCYENQGDNPLGYKVVFETELYQLPAHKDFKKMDKDNKIRACYLHACLKYVNREYLTNASLRERFGLNTTESSKVSVIIKNTVEEELIKLKDPNTAPRYFQYLPIWA